MLYFSGLDKIKIYTEEQGCIGYLDDLIFSIDGPPYIKKMVVFLYEPGRLPLLKKKKEAIIPIEDLLKINHAKIIIKKDFTSAKIEENELFVKTNLLDTQVIDIEGNNIVRVNDVLIQNEAFKPLSIYGVDIGIFGLLRWFKLEGLLERLLHFFGKSIPQYTLAWSGIQPLELTRGRVALKFRFDKLRRLHPADIADYLETQNLKNAMMLLEGMDKKYLVKVISELNSSFQVSLIKRMSIDRIASLISLMEPDDAADVIAQFSKKRREDIFNRLSKEDVLILRKLLKLSSTPLGQYLNTEFMTVSPEQTAQDVVKWLRKGEKYLPSQVYMYVINKQNQPVGVFGFGELLLQNPGTPVFKFMIQRVVVANLHTPFEVALRRMIKYKISLLPVLDDKKRMIGVVAMADLVEGKK